MLRNVELKPGLALGSWPSCVRHGGGDEAMVMGGLVLADDEVNSVSKRLVEHGIEVTAVHNPMLGTQSRLFFMRFCANNAAKLAQGRREALDKAAIAGS